MSKNVQSDFWISPNYKAFDQKKLKLDVNNNRGWKKATDIFQDRINGRFINPIEALKSHEDDKVWEFSGFSIICLDCLIIETLNQFYKGLDETTGKHWSAFWNIFKNSSYFKEDFDISKKARIFYSHFRCGILHQAQTKKKSKIRIDTPKMIQQCDMSNIEEGLIVNRNLFHEALTNEIKDYIKKLRNPKIKNDYVLREKFIDKMNIITNS